ncbi:hypothetical protein Acr_15g0001020 [Actinidia rufa]|uniref:Uncharacterized protein n=1 Tax=Actinidia rufa TaxID=165716 RepID=A0A7J0FS33_9ERIC|nr:hypothetical protein Acr_15g0001020 [Actinidia rufa]
MGRSQSQNSLKYKTKTCECGKRVAVSISESDRNPARLSYFVILGGCNYWEWCKAINPYTLLQASSPRQVMRMQSKNYNSTRWKNPCKGQ